MNLEEANKMLNPELHLNQNIFDEKVDKLATRDGYGLGLVAVGEVEKSVVVLTADLSESTRTDDFREKYPERFIECGVAEQNMAAISAGLAVSGKIPFMSSYAVFSPGKNWETIRTTIVYNNANVKIAGHHAGLSTGPDGVTHQATEDITITRVWPNMRVICPCDALEAQKATIAAAYIKGPIYLRFSRDKTPIITTDKTPYDPDKNFVYWISAKPQVAIFATGYEVYYALLAAKKLQEENIEVLVVNVANIKPIDNHTIIEALKNAGAGVTVEDHQIAGGLGGAIAELSAKEYPVPIEFVGLNDTFAESSASTDLISKYGLNDTAIINAVKKILKRKDSSK